MYLESKHCPRDGRPKPVHSRRQEYPDDIEISWYARIPRQSTGRMPQTMVPFDYPLSGQTAQALHHRQLRRRRRQCRMRHLAKKAGKSSSFIASGLQSSTRCIAAGGGFLRDSGSLCP
jgi:hypothetical protein